MSIPVAVNAQRGRPPTDPAERAAFRAELLGAAERLLSTRGVDDVSVDDVAAAAGVSRATVYRHVGGRDQIVVAVALRRIDEWVDGLAPRLARCGSAAEVIVETFRLTLRSADRDPGLAALVESGTARRAGDVVVDDPLALRRLEAFRSLVAESLAPHDAELRPGLDLGELADHLLGALLDRLGAATHGWPGDDITRWLATWVLPAVLDERPELPGRVGLSDR